MIGRYLERIGIQGPVQRNLTDLHRLVLAQLTHVPFENLDVWAKDMCPSLEVADLFEKIVVQKRGGYCFELNTLFRYLLNSLGFEAYQAVSGLVNPEGSVRSVCHNVIICTLDDEPYLIDVGFGGPTPMGAMPLKEGSWENFKLYQQDGFWYLDRWVEDSYQHSIRFRQAPSGVEEMLPLNFFVSQYPTSHFRHRLNVSMKQPDGSLHRVLGDRLHIRKDGQIQERTVTNEELPAILQEHFGISFTEIPMEKPLCGEF